MRLRAAAIVLVLAATPAFAASPWIITNDNVKTECGACHMAYQPGFLPARSWQAIMSDLSNHFGEDATITDTAVVKDITDYLVANAGDAGGKPNRWIRRVAADETPLRITDLMGWRGAHGEVIGSAMMAKAGTAANCVFCHKAAAAGIFGDD
jgi:hypothetical protein